MARKDERQDREWEVRGGSFDNDPKTNEGIQRILYPQQSIFKPEADLDKIALFMSREYDPKQVNTVGAYRLALKEMCMVGIIVPPYSHLNRQGLENLYIRTENKVLTELRRRGKLSRLEV